MLGAWEMIEVQEVETCAPSGLRYEYRAIEDKK
jgi:hypothetical protein